jgi:universal stress protein F
MFEKILVPIDIAEPALAELAISLAVQFAAAESGEVRLIHVVPDLPFGLGVFLPPDLSGELEASAHAVLREIASKADLPYNRSSTTVRSGVVYHEVVAEARAFGARLVVIGSHNLSRGRALLGSNAETIVRHADCAVLVVRAHEAREGAYWLVPSIAS